MSERFDLNSLRAVTTASKKSLDERGQKIIDALQQQQSIDIGTREEQIEKLKGEIGRLEEQIRTWTGPLARFDALSLEGQQTEMARELTGLVPENEWDKEVYRAGLRRDSQKNPDILRLAVAKAKLQKLESEV